MSYDKYTDNSIWTINSKIENSIKTKIESKGKKLSEWDIKILYGIKTGYNEAFIVDKKTKDFLIKSNQKNAEIIRPIIRGRDIERYSYSQPDLYMICTFPSKKYDINMYPEVKKHLLSFGIEKLEQSGKTYNVNGNTIKSRKKTNNKWFETQDSISYSEEFYKHKIVYPCIMASGPSFAFDDQGNFLPAPGNIITGNHLKYLLGILCSKTYYFALRKFYMGGGIEGELKTNRLLLLPVPKYEHNQFAKNIENFVSDMNINNYEQITEKIELEIKTMLDLEDNEFSLIQNTKY